MGLPLNFRNILNLFNVKDFNSYFQTTYTIDSNVSIFQQGIEGYNGDGMITLAELKNFMGLVDFPDYMAERMFNMADSNGDGILSTDELKNLFSSFDADGSNTLEWSEGLNIYNSLADINIPSSTTFTQYSNLLATTQGTVHSYDVNGNSKIDANEYDEILERMGVMDGGATANNLIDLYDTNNDNAISFEEMFLQNLQWDTNKNGFIDTKNGEAQELMDQLPWYIKPRDSMSQIEQIVASLILSYDADGDKEMGEEEFKNYMVKGAALPMEMANEMMALYAGGNNSFSFEELVAAYNGADGNNDDKLSYEELINFQNTFSNIQIDSNQINEKQYSGLYKAGASAIKGYDDDGDGEISVKEYRAAIKKAEDAYRQAGQDVPETIGQHLAENFVRLFDMDKNGKVSIIEIINQYAVYDVNKDGQVSGGEFIDQQERMEDSRLWDNVNEEFITPGDTDFDKELNLTEFQNVLTQKGLPQYIADDAFTLFDMNLDGKLSRLELMEMFSRYDGSVVNVDYIEEQTGTQYQLFTGNANQVLDDYEKLKLYEDLAALDAGVDFNVDAAKGAQYEKLLAKSSELINTYDQYKDGVLTPDEYKNYFKALGLPGYLADSIISAYDVSGDGSLDLFENTQMLLDYDVNGNGGIEFHEEFKLYDDLTGIGLNITSENRIQYNNIYNSVKEFLNSYDVNDRQELNRDNTIQIDELAKYFLEKGLPEVYADLITTAYDVNGDGGLDVLEWMKSYADFDFDANGQISAGEELALHDFIAGTALPNIQDSKRYSALEATAKSLVQRYDIVDNDKKLSSAELIPLMQELGLPDYIAGEFVAAHDLNGDGGIDRMEWMRAATNYDRNENGITEFNEELELYSTLTGANIVAITEDEIKQYQAIYNYLQTFYAQKDDTTDRILSPEELEDYFTQLELPSNMATLAVDLYDINGDGGLDIYEWMRPHIQFDINKNGKLEFNELMGMNAVICDPDLPIDPVTMDVSQVQNLYNYSLNYIRQVDTENDDKQISENELIKYYKLQGLSDNVASAVLASQDSNADGYLDLMEWLSTHLQYDANHTGILEFNELLNLYQDATGVELNTTDANLYQHQALFNYTVASFKTADTSTDKKLSPEEFKTWLKASYGMTDDSAASIVNYYDSTIGNGDGNLDTLEFTKALLDNDQNTNGKWDLAEILNFFDKGLPSIDLGGVNDDNINQYWALHSYSVKYANAYGGGDGKFSSGEFRSWLMNSYAIPEDMANDIINHYDLNADGQMDSLEFTQGLIAADSNKSGIWDAAEVMSFFDKAMPGVDLGVINDSNIKQYWSLYSYTIKNTNLFGGADKKISGTELRTWLKDYYAMTEDDANQIVSYYDATIGDSDGNLDSMEFTKALIDVDANKNGVWDPAEIINFFDNGVSSVNLGNVDDNNLKQYQSLYGYAVKNVNTYGGGDKKMSADELKTWLKQYYALTDDMANQIISRNDLNNDGMMDALEFTEGLLGSDTNTNGNWDYAEIMNFFDDAFTNIELGGVDESNIQQYWGLYAYAIKNINAYAGSDKKMSGAEFKTWLINSYAMTEDQANQIIQTYGGADGMDAMEFTKALIDLDENQNGSWDTAEIINFLDDGSANLLENINEENITQYWSFYSYSIGVINTFGGSDKLMSADEFQSWLAKGYGITASMANQIVSHYGGANGIDAIEFTNALVNLDRGDNNNNKWDYPEILKFFDDALPSVNLGDVSGSNFYKTWNAFSTAMKFVNSTDFNYDKITQAGEYEQILLKYGYTNAAAMANKANSAFGGGNGIDVFEWMDAVYQFDKNDNGVMDGTEVTDYYNFLSS